MNIADLREKRSKLLADMTELSAGNELNAEARTKFDAMDADLRAIDEDIKRAERVNALNESRAKQSERPGIENPREEEVRSSFLNYLRTGEVEKRDLTSAANGAVVVPTLFDKDVVSAQKSYGEIYNLVDRMETDNGSSIQMVLSNDTTNGLTSVTVGTDAAETDPSFTGATLSVGNYTTGIVKVDNGLLMDSGFDLDAFIRDKFAQRFFRGASNLIVNGGTNVASLLTAYSAGITTGTVNVVKYLDLVAAMTTLDPSYQANSVWTMSNAGLAAILSIVDSSNRPVFLPGYGSADQGFIGSILGRPVKLVTQMPTVATGNVPIQYGDFKSAYTFRQQRPGVFIQRLNEKYTTAFETAFVGFARVGGVATNAGVAPVVGVNIK